MKQSGAHTHPDGSMGPAVLVVALAVVATAIAGPIIHAVGELLRIVLIAAAVLAGLGITGCAILLTRMRRGSLHRRSMVVVQPADPARPLLARTTPRQLPPAEQHIHFHGVSADDIAAILARTENPG